MPPKDQQQPNKDQQQNENQVCLAASMMPQTVSVDGRTVDVVFFTSIDVPRYDYWKGEPYILRFSPDGADLSKLNNGAPVFDNHESYGGAASQKGVVEKGWRDGKEFKATLRFSRRTEVEGLWQDIQDNIVQKFSMGVSILEKKELAQEKGKLRVVEVTKWQPYEISTAPLPADNNTRTLSAEPGADSEVGRATSPQEQEMAEETIPNTGAQARPDPNAIASAALAERNRVIEITKLGNKLGLAELAGTHVESGATLEDFRAAALTSIAERQVETRGATSTATVTRDERDTRLSLAGDAVLALVDSKQKLDDQNPFRGMRVSRMAEELLTRSGQNTRGMSIHQIAELSMHAAADFPLILADSARKTMLAGYAAATPTYRLWTKKSTNPDFKTVSRLRLSEAPAPLKVAEGAQITLGTMSESREQYALLTYGRGLSFTRQMLINDDLGAFMDLNRAFGIQTARFENKTVYAVLTANAAMSDSVTLFHATHGNSSTGTLGNTGLDTMLTSMAVQKGLDGVTVLNLEPEFLIVPKAKEATARVAMTAVGPSVKSSDQNWFAGRFTVVADAELDATSTTAWYAAANPSIAPGIEYAHLEGAEGPQMIRKENEGAVLGVQIYSYIDFAAKAVDWRPLYYSTGS